MKQWKRAQKSESELADALLIEVQFEKNQNLHLKIKFPLQTLD